MKDETEDGEKEAPADFEELVGGGTLAKGG